MLCFQGEHSGDDWAVIEHDTNRDRCQYLVFAHQTFLDAKVFDPRLSRTLVTTRIQRFILEPFLHVLV